MDGHTNAHFFSDRDNRLQKIAKVFPQPSSINISIPFQNRAKLFKGVVLFAPGSPGDQRID